MLVWSFLVLKKQEFPGKATFPLSASDPPDGSLVNDVRSTNTHILTEYI